MTLYMLAAFAAILIYTGTAVAAAMPGISGVRAVTASKRSAAMVVNADAHPQAAGDTPFQELGCVQPDGDSR